VLELCAGKWTPSHSSDGKAVRFVHAVRYTECGKLDSSPEANKIILIFSNLIVDAFRFLIFVNMKGREIAQVCLSCVKYQKGDALGLGLSFLCFSPYIVLIYTAGAAYITK